MRTPVVNTSSAADTALRARNLEVVAWVVAAAKEQPSLVHPSEPSSTTTPSPSVEAATAPSLLPPEWVCQRESHCTYGINTGNGYFGKWQFALSWGGKLGLPADITQATPAQEDEAARELWAGGAGCGNWNAC